MNKFLASSVKMIARHGLPLVYTSIVTYTDPATRKTEKIRTNFTHKIYAKQLIANQYNFPDLINKDSVMFYLANNTLGHAVQVGDEIQYKNTAYRITSTQETIAFGEIVLYRMVGVKG